MNTRDAAKKAYSRPWTWKELLRMIGDNRRHDWKQSKVNKGFTMKRTLDMFEKVLMIKPLDEVADIKSSQLERMLVINILRECS